MNTVFHYKLMNEIWRNIDEKMRLFIFNIFTVKNHFHRIETYFPYFHCSPVGLLSFNEELVDSQYTNFKGEVFSKRKFKMTESI